MNRRTFTKSLVAAFALGLAAPFAAQAQEEEVFGRQLMTQQEIQEHQRNMRTLQGGEREAYRQEHHERMLERARERGVDLPDQPRGDASGRPQGAGPERGYGPRDGGGRPEGAGPDRGYGSGGGSGGGAGPGGGSGAGGSR